MMGAGTEGGKSRNGVGIGSQRREWLLEGGEGQQSTGDSGGGHLWLGVLRKTNAILGRGTWKVFIKV